MGHVEVYIGITRFWGDHHINSELRVSASSRTGPCQMCAFEGPESQSLEAPAVAPKTPGLLFRAKGLEFRV